MEYELDMWYLGLIKKGWDKFVKQQGVEKKELNKAVAKQLSGLGVSEGLAESVLRNYNENLNSWNERDLIKFAKHLRRETKPIIIAANKIDVKGSEKNIERLKERFGDYIIIPCSAFAELALREFAKNNLIKYIPGENKFEITGNLNDKEKKILDYIKIEILDKYGGTGIQDVLNKAVFDLLKYIAIFPGGLNNLVDSQGRILPDCFLMKDGSTALDFAYKLHTDFGKNFIRAIDVRKKLPVGKDHVLQSRDVVEIMSGK